MPTTKPRARCFPTVCSSCGKEKYPTAVEPPGPDWICKLCQSTPAETRANRKAGAAQSLETRRRNAGEVV